MPPHADNALRPLVSIIMPAYNSATVLPDSIGSVQAQTHADWELLITDDCSRDETRTVAEFFAETDSRIRYFRLEHNSGAAQARNRSLTAARGRYIAFLDADDIWLHEKLERQLAFMGNYNCAFSFTGYSIIQQGGGFSPKVIDSRTPDSISYRDLLMKKCTVGCSTVMLDRERFPEIIMDDIRTGQDYALWLKLLRTSGEVALNMRERLTGYRISPGSISRNKFKKAKRQWEIYRNLEHIPTLQSMFYMFFYAKNALIRR